MPRFRVYCRQCDHGLDLNSAVIQLEAKDHLEAAGHFASKRLKWSKSMATVEVEQLDERAAGRKSTIRIETQNHVPKCQALTTAG